MTDIEKEIQARVEYKMNEFLGNVQKTANYSWHHGIKTGEAKYINYWEALSMLRDFLNNELKRPLPSTNLVEEFKTKHKGEVLDEIIKKLSSFGYLPEKEEGKIRRFLIKKIDMLQN